MINNILAKFDSAYFFLGRTLLGIYFIIPGAMKISGYQATLGVMQAKAVPVPEVLLPLTILMQIGLGAMLILAKQLRISALLLFGLTILINLYMHNFWDLQAGQEYSHELQNFIKNLAIAAGLLVLASKQK